MFLGERRVPQLERGSDGFQLRFAKEMRNRRYRNWTVIQETLNREDAEATETGGARDSPFERGPRDRANARALGGIQGTQLALPGVAQLTNRFAETNGQIDDGLQPLRIDG